MISGGAPYNLEVIALTFAFASGAALVYFKIDQAHKAKEGRTKWLWLLALKFLMFVFITPVLDLMVLSWVQQEGQTRLTAA